MTKAKTKRIQMELTTPYKSINLREGLVYHIEESDAQKLVSEGKAKFIDHKAKKASSK